MPRARILIVSTGPLSRNPRVLKEAGTLGAAGFDVTVLTLTDTAQFEGYDRQLLANAPFRKVVVDLHTAKPVARLILIGQKSVTWLSRKLTRLGWESSFALGPVWLLGRRVRYLAADLTIVHTELPFCLAADLLARGRRVAADFEDWHSRDLLPSDRQHRPVRLLAEVERELLHRCVYTSTTSDKMADGLHAAYGGLRPIVLTNSFPLPPKPVARPDGRVPSLFWYSQTIGPGRGVEEFLAAWVQTAPLSRLCLLGNVGDSYRKQLVTRLPESWRNRLQFLPFIPPAELPVEIARHDLGLALELNQPANRNLTITNKILQYLGAGIGVIASDTAGQREVLSRAPGAGCIVALDDSRALVNLLDSLLVDNARLDAMGASARRAAEEIYCWEKEAPRLIEAVESALRTATP